MTPHNSDPDDDTPRPKRDPITYRNPATVIAILGHLAETDEKMTWDQALETFTTDTLNWKTVENILYDLARFGAIARVGHPPKTRAGADTRAIFITTLGRHWLEGTTATPLEGSTT